LEIRDRIVEQSLFTFRAPVSILRSAIRKHLASHSAEGPPPPRVLLVDRDRYVLA
jgi:hypothetical protein